MIELIGTLTALLWIVVGGILGQRYYRQLRDEEGLRPQQALFKAIGWGFIRPPWLIALGAWAIVSVGITKKK